MVVRKNWKIILTDKFFESLKRVCCKVYFTSISKHVNDMAPKVIYGNFDLIIKLNTERIC